MTAGASVLLGFEVGTGAAVHLPIRHMVVTGQTQEAGKTTTLEALIGRSRLPAAAFVTKRGEGSFDDARRMPPYFRERADWQFVSAVFEATMLEKMRFERSWIMRVCKGARSLADVQRNVRAAMVKAKGIDANVYLQLDAYLDIIVPRVASVKWAKSVDLQPGVNVVDVADRDRFPPELQGLVMRSTLEWIHDHAHGTITIIPEAWKFIPQARGSPVKLACETLIREGAGLKNYVWLDSQDIGGIDKQILRSCPVWLLGVQREANEVGRVLDNIPAGTKKPKAADIQQLRKGEFFACFGETVVRTYVQPLWLGEAEARAVALGDRPARAAPPSARPPAVTELRTIDDITPESLGELGEQLRASITAELQAEHDAALRAVEEDGRRRGFEQGWAAAAAALSGRVHGVIKGAEEFLAELREISLVLAERVGPLPPLSTRAEILASEGERAFDGEKLDRAIQLLERRSHQ